MGGATGDDYEITRSLLNEGGDGFARVALLDEGFDGHALGEFGDALAHGGFKMEFVGAFDVEADVAVKAGHGMKDNELGAELGGELAGGGEYARRTIAEVNGGGNFAEGDFVKTGIFHVGAGEDRAAGIMENLRGDAAEKEATKGPVAVCG